jgi:hypothetical protein
MKPDFLPGARSLEEDRPRDPRGLKVLSETLGEYH